MRLMPRSLTLLFIVGLFAIAAQAADPFSIIALPDTQFYNKLPAPNLLTKQAQWIVANQTEANIVFVTQLGDITDDGANYTYWKNAQAAIATLDGKVPYSVCFGNHDLYNKDKVKGVDLCREYFGDAAHQGQQTYGGKSPNGLSFYQTFSASGFNFLHLNVVHDPNAATLEWANEIIKQNPGKITIVSTHDYLGVNGRRDAVGERIWDKLVNDNPQIFLVMNGHYHGEAQLLSTNASGGTVAQILADYQKAPHGGDGYLRRITFKPDQGQILVETYSPSLDRFESSYKSKFTYTAKFDAAANTIAISGILPAPATRPVAVPSASVGIPYKGGLYTQDFDTLGIVGTNLPAGWSIGEIPAASPALEKLAQIRDVATATPFPTQELEVWNSSHRNRPFFPAANGADNASSSNRCLVLNPIGVGTLVVEFHLINATKKPLTSAKVDYDLRAWDAGRKETPSWSCYFSTNGFSDWVAVPALSPRKSTSVMATINFAKPIPPGSSLYFRWVDDNNRNRPNRAYGLDNFHFAAN